MKPEKSSHLAVLQEVETLCDELLDAADLPKDLPCFVLDDGG